ncbi:hypothetical protein AB0M50_11700 [Nonomuraea fuscirosea]|uniref:hypothetical protein n=1 Tax=Nonomuraea fuscirosea TaxID=1291556 RepID=UPI003447F227
MDIAEMVHTYVETLVWPAVVLGCVLAFRRQLRELFSRMRRIETLGGAAEFEARIREAAEIAEEVQERSPRSIRPGEVRRRAVLTPTSHGVVLDGDGTVVLHRLVPERISAEDLAGDRRIDPLLDDAFKMVENLPATAIVTAHARMESFVYLFLRNMNGNSSIAESSLVGALKQIGVSARTLSLAERLVHLGDQVRYENTGVTRAAAIQYIESCTVVLSELRSLVLPDLLPSGGDAESLVPSSNPSDTP